MNAEYTLPCTISIRRTMRNVIEFTIFWHYPNRDQDYSNTYHANREATFHGPCDGNAGHGAQQLTGGGSTLWREDDKAMLAAFRRKYRKTRNIFLAT